MLDESTVCQLPIKNHFFPGYELTLNLRVSLTNGDRLPSISFIFLFFQVMHEFIFRHLKLTQQRNADGTTISILYEQKKIFIDPIISSTFELTK